MLSYIACALLTLPGTHAEVKQTFLVDAPPASVSAWLHENPDLLAKTLGLTIVSQENGFVRLRAKTPVGEWEFTLHEATGKDKFITELVKCHKGSLTGYRHQLTLTEAPNRQTRVCVTLRAEIDMSDVEEADLGSVLDGAVSLFHMKLYQEFAKP